MGANEAIALEERQSLTTTKRHLKAEKDTPFRSVN